MKEKRQLSQEETDALFGMLVKALDKKQLNSKTEVLYDPETEKITEIKYLVMHQNEKGGVTFQLKEKRAITFRKRATPEVPAVAAAAAEAPQAVA
jgi:hypothetical protein